MLKVLVAPQAYKGTATAGEVAKAIRAGVIRAMPEAEVEMLPLSDGGDGFLDIVLNNLGGTKREEWVQDPWGSPVRAEWGILPDEKTAIIETAQVVGWAKTPREKLNPMTASTFGVGELILKAVEAGCRHFVMGLGGSATNDGGAGMAQALGYHLLDKEGNELTPGGGALAKLDKISKGHSDGRLKGCDFICACDVTAHLLGRTGATQMFGPQKGATSEMIPVLEKGLTTLAAVVRKDLGKSIQEMECGGAAGGLAAGCATFLGARLLSGIHWVLDNLAVDELLAWCDLVITGEGCLDGQTLFHKGPVGLARCARRHGVPVVALVGSTRGDYKTIHQEGITSVMAVFPTINEKYPLKDRIEDAAEELIYAHTLRLGSNDKTTVAST